MTLPDTLVADLGDRCGECDRQLVWGGTAGYLPHTAEYHAMLRRNLIRALIGRIWARIAARTGHRITIWFTADRAWATCAGCDWCSYTWSESGHARHEGHQHLAAVGYILEATETFRS